MQNPAIQCQHVFKSFVETKEGSRSFKNAFFGARKKIEAVSNVSFDVNRNEVFGLLGANGSGKSTLIRLLATLLLPDSGTLQVFGYDVTKDILPVRRLINRVSVEASFFKKLSAVENLRYAARLYGLDPEEGIKKSLSILDYLGIPKEKATTSLEHLSRGMQQKVAIARAFMTSPTLILLDEPTTGLDPISRREVQEFVKNVMAEHDATIVLTTHDMDEAEKLCHRIAIIDQGKILTIDTADSLKKKAKADSLEEAFFTLTGKTWEETQYGD